MNDEKAYNNKVKDYVIRYASAHLVNPESIKVSTNKDVETTEKGPNNEALSETSVIAEDEEESDGL